MINQNYGTDMSIRSAQPRQVQQTQPRAQPVRRGWMGPNQVQPTDEQQRAAEMSPEQREAEAQRRQRIFEMQRQRLMQHSGWPEAQQQMSVQQRAQLPMQDSTNAMRAWWG